MFKSPLLILSVLAVAVLGQDDPQFEHISIGPRSDPLSVVPGFVNVDEGWYVTLQFGPGKHSIRQSTFEAPCTFGGGFWSWNYTTSDPSSFVILDIWQNSKEKQSLYFFDAESDSCEQGMVFAINPPSEDAFNEFRDRAINGEIAKTSTVASFAPITTIAEPASTRGPTSTPSSSQATRATTRASTASSLSATSTAASTGSATPSSTGSDGGNGNGAGSLIANEVVIVATVISLFAGMAVL